MKLRKRHRTGFTLTELLIVVAVICILCAILFGVFTRSRQKANQTICHSNLKQISLALQQYVQDHDSKYPKAVVWEESVMPYVKNQQVLRCPSDPRELSRTDISNYSIIGGRINFLLAPGMTSGANEATLSNAAKTIIILDAAPDGFVDSVDLPSSCGLTMRGRPAQSFAGSTLHFGGGHYLFGDGHVKWLKVAAAAQCECDAGPLQDGYR